jgi:hypothetical protein
VRREGSTLVLGPGLRLRPDPRCIRGETVAGAYAHVCAAREPGETLPFDDPAVQQARRDALAWWIPLLGDALVCLTTLALDSVRYAGAITVSTDPSLFRDDPFARLFPGRIVQSDLFCRVAPPSGPVIERYAGVTWPGGRFSLVHVPEVP